MDRAYNVHYILNSDLKSITTLTFVAMPAFDEVGEYTDEEAKKVIGFLSKQKVPKFVKTYTIGSYTYKTYEEWNEFVKNNKIGIKKLLSDE
jgi:hypothetical protein